LGTLDEVIELVTKNKWVGIFIFLWGLYFFFGSINGFYSVATYPYWSIAQKAIYILQDIIRLLIAGVLALLGLTILGIDVLPTSALIQQKKGEVTE